MIPSVPSPVPAGTESRKWPHVQCSNDQPHAAHTHVNGSGRGCGLPEWCEGLAAVVSSSPATPAGGRQDGWTACATCGHARGYHTVTGCQKRECEAFCLRFAAPPATPEGGRERMWGVLYELAGHILPCDDEDEARRTVAHPGNDHVRVMYADYEWKAAQ